MIDRICRIDEINPVHSENLVNSVYVDGGLHATRGWGRRQDPASPVAGATFPAHSASSLGFVSTSTNDHASNPPAHPQPPAASRLSDTSRSTAQVPRAPLSYQASSRLRASAFVRVSSLPSAF